MTKEETKKKDWKKYFRSNKWKKQLVRSLEQVSKIVEEHEKKNNQTKA